MSTAKGALELKDASASVPPVSGKDDAEGAPQGQYEPGRIFEFDANGRDEKWKCHFRMRAWDGLSRPHDRDRAEAGHGAQLRDGRCVTSW